MQAGTSVTKVPNPIDRPVGARVRMRRMLIGMSQEKLGEALGLTFQQVQKYEKGANRISASRLQQISEALNIPLAYFFKGAPVSDGVVSGGFAESGSEDNFASDFVMTAEGLSLNRAFARIADPKVRKKIVDLVTTLAEGSKG
ncbi:helix-turn-helix transcriptional regulator [uncultured Rhodoblastus sp.]|uniref:helix-turn-helix domain-containing protein n=1 Tax=uncultured Rhodoblastus sp. TaxID=543037 RepID=UPI0025EC9E89|nr:helix-turn-helix transcriptional regulator [uncultured Rhodoblastus sp.]